jgi:sugar lactone lactonase YvrE
VTEYGQHVIRRVTREGIVTTAAGTGTVGSDNGLGNVATFNQPMGIAVGADGTIYVSEAAGNRIRKLVKSGTVYTVSTLAGSGVAGFAEGIGTAAQFSSPRALAVDGNGVVYVADTDNNRIRRMDPSGAVVTLAGSGTAGTADGAGNVAQFNSPQGIAIVNGALVTSDTNTQRLRQITLKPGGNPTQANSWGVQTLAGPPPGIIESSAADGPGDVARFSSPRGIAADASGTVYVAEYSLRKVRKVTPANGYFPIGVPASTTQTEPVQLYNPDGVLPNGERPYFLYPHALANGETSEARTWDFVVPLGVKAFEFTVTAEADTAYGLTLPGVQGQNSGGLGSSDVIVRTFAGGNNYGYANGAASVAQFNALYQIVMDAAGNFYTADSNNNAIRRITPNGQVTTVAGVEGKGPGSADGLGTVAQFYGPLGVAVTPDGKTIYVGEYYNSIIRRIALTGTDPTRPDNWTVSTIAGLAGNLSYVDNTSGNLARFNRIYGIALDPSGNLYVAETAGNRIRRLHLAGPDPAQAVNWRVSTLAGDTSAAAGVAGNTNGVGNVARFSDPFMLATDRAGNVYVTDVSNEQIRKITPGGEVSTLAGSGIYGYVDGPGFQAQFEQPFGITVDSAGYVYVGDQNNYRIRRVSPTGVVTTVAGTGTSGVQDGPGNVATLLYTDGLVASPSGDLYFTNLDRIRVVQRVLK